MEAYLEGLEFIPVKPSIYDAYKAQLKAPEIYNRLHPPKIGAKKVWTDWKQEKAEKMNSQTIFVNGIEVRKYTLTEIAKECDSTVPTVSKKLRGL